MRFLSLSLLLALTACSVEDQTPSSSTKAESVSSDTLEALVGTYALTATLKDTAKYPAPVGNVNTTTNVYRLAEITLNKDSGQLEITELNCTAEILSDSSFQVRGNKNVQQATTPIQSVLEVTEKDGVVTIVRPEAVQVLGATLKDPKNDKLPTDEKDERLTLFKNFDSKKDEFEKFRGAKSIATFTTPSIGFIPGIKISSDIFYAIRTVGTYEATLDSATGELKGSLENTTEQSVVAVSNIIASSAKGVTKITTPRSQGSVVMKRIEQGSTCETIIETFVPSQAGN